MWIFGYIDIEKCMCALHACMHAYVCMYVCVCIYMYVLRICMYVSVRVRMCMYVYVRVSMCMSLYVFVCMCISYVNVSMCMYLCWNVGMSPSPTSGVPASAALDTMAARALCPSRRCRTRAKELASALGHQRGWGFIHKEMGHNIRTSTWT